MRKILIFEIVGISLTIRSMVSLILFYLSIYEKTFSII